MKHNISLIFIHILRFPCCKHSTQKDDDKESYRFFDTTENMYSFENIKDVWNALLERNEIAQKSNSIQIKELTIEVLTDKINDTDQHVILGETNKNGVMIVSKLMVKNEHYVLSNEIAMYHDCTSISNITLMNGHWTFENKNNKIDTIEIISIH